MNPNMFLIAGVLYTVFVFGLGYMGGKYMNR
jgi:hypothetical protein